jgi:hypothetical protein
MSELGCEHKVADAVWNACHNRAMKLELKHFLTKNQSVDRRSERARVLNDGGELEIGKAIKDYYPAGTVMEIVGGLLNMQAVFRQLWPLDWTPDVLLRWVLNQCISLLNECCAGFCTSTTICLE